MKKLYVLILSIFITLSFNLPAQATTYTNQTVTAYVALSGKLTYYETTPVRYSTAAMRPATCRNVNSGTTLPKGTIITTSKGLTFPDARLRSSFSVYDMGDVNCTRDVTDYFFDVYFGVKGTADETNAKKFYYASVTYTTR
ncbi:hypothetical protein [Priestia koreensis]|uniref:Uncharacterized protein n=1 Tax=Priestia koreensis TaxID=284581 RepID=A0A0M0KZF9_9BACI|nr:hypothetical protein [Priestia koreensis]KOO44194.1 hypothetical protein AMD01_13865 [Priestia koreensis]